MRSLGRLKSPHEFAFNVLLRKQRVYIYNSVAAILVGLAALKSQSYKGSVGCSLNERMHFALPCSPFYLLYKKGYTLSAQIMIWMDISL